MDPYCSMTLLLTSVFERDILCVDKNTSESYYTPTPLPISCTSVKPLHTVQRFAHFPWNPNSGELGNGESVSEWNTGVGMTCKCMGRGGRVIAYWDDRARYEWKKGPTLWAPALQMKGWWESNINVLFGISFTLKPNKKLTTKIVFSNYDP